MIINNLHTVLFLSKEIDYQRINLDLIQTLQSVIKTQGTFRGRFNSLIKTSVTCSQIING